MNQSRISVFMKFYEMESSIHLLSQTILFLLVVDSRMLCNSVLKSHAHVAIIILGGSRKHKLLQEVH